MRNFVFTNVDRDGMLDGANREEVAWVARAAGEGERDLLRRHRPARGPPGARQPARELHLDGLDGVIVGKALYEQRFTRRRGQGRRCGGVRVSACTSSA